mmetsp:Transcript_29744/g.67167  ORF Transcript_29744/g.67167 Transcript_29744/m.67167 type:complete len:267 (-) Transcript_29744:1018-1818(-)
MTLPLGSMGLMYRPLSWLKMRPRPPPLPDLSRDENSMRSGSIGVESTSNMNSCGTSGTSGCSSCSLSSSGSSFSSSSSCSSSFSLSSSCWSIGGGGGGGGGGGIMSSSSMGVLMNVPLGAMASLTASRRSSLVICLPSSAAAARATSQANISARCPWQPARMASSQRYWIWDGAILTSLRNSRAKTMAVLRSSSFSTASSSAFSASGVACLDPGEKPRTASTASTRELISILSASADRATAMRSRRWSRSSPSSGLKVAMRSGWQG